MWGLDTYTILHHTASQCHGVFMWGLHSGDERQSPWKRAIYIHNNIMYICKRSSRLYSVKERLHSEDRRVGSLQANKPDESARKHYRCAKEHYTSTKERPIQARKSVLHSRDRRVGSIHPSTPLSVSQLVSFWGARQAEGLLAPEPPRATRVARIAISQSSGQFLL